MVGGYVLGKLGVNVFLFLFLFIVVSSLFAFVYAKTLIKDVVTVNPLSYYSYRIVTKYDGAMITLSINVTGGPSVHVAVMDSSNYTLFQQQWVEGEQIDIYVYFVRESVKSTSAEVELGSSGDYYIVLINVNWFFSSDVSIEVILESRFDYRIIAGGIIILLGVILSVVYFHLKKRKN